MAEVTGAWRATGYLRTDFADELPDPVSRDDLLQRFA